MGRNYLSISSSFNYNICIEEQIRLIKEAGFKYFSLGSNLEYFDYTKKSERDKILPLLKSNNIRIDTIHGMSLHQDQNLDFLKSTIKAAKELNAETIVIHVSSFNFKKEEYAKNLSALMEVLDPFVKLINREKINIALENVFPYYETDLLLEFYSKIKSEYIGFCYDSSHDQIDGPRNYDLLDKMSDNLIAVHLSDRIKPFTDHVIPGEGFIDFDIIIEKLAKSSFRGPYLFEVMMTHSKFKDTQEFLKELKTEGDLFLNKLEIQRQKVKINKMKRP